MEGKLLLESFNERHKEFLNNNNSVDTLIEEISYFERFIPEFFSKNGEGKGIRNMYSEIRSIMESGNIKCINCIDINKSNHIYKEYLEGMLKFIDDISNVNIDNKDELKPFVEKFNTAKDKDSVFIESLYDGKLNDEKSMSLTEAVCNIEVLIDFIPTMKDIKSKCISVNESVNYIDNNIKKDLMKQCSVMLCESVNKFCYSTINAVINTYNSINNKINEPINEKEVDEYQLF